MNIGDTVAWPEGVPFDRELVRISMLRRGTVERAARGRRKNGATNAARVVVEGMEADRLRLSDPFEHARIYLGRRGVPVFTAAVYDPRFNEGSARRLISSSPWVVGDEWVADREAVMAKATAAGWDGGIVQHHP